MDNDIKLFLNAVKGAKAETIWNVVHILQKEHQHCFDIAMEMQNRDLVKLLYSLYPSKVMVELTLLAGDVTL